METTLRNKSLLQEIFSHASDPEWLNLALTCCAFRNPAQDFVWETLDCGLLPLVQLLPSLKFRKDRNQTEYRTGDYTVYFLRGTISAVDVDRLKLFGSRIQNVTCTRRKKACIIDVSTYLALVHALKGHTLLPNLKAIYWTLQSQDSSAILQLFFSPKLKYVDISTKSPTLNPSWSDDMCSFVHQLASLLVELSKLSIDIPSCQELLDLIIPSFPFLETLELVASPEAVINAPYMTSISKFDNLCNLAIEVQRFDLHTSKEILLKLCFNKLEELSISCSVEQIIRLLDISQLPSLSQCAIRFIVPVLGIGSQYNFEWAKLFHALKHSTTTAKFKSLYIEPLQQDWPGNARVYNKFLHSYDGILFSDISDSLLQLDLTILGLDFPFLESLLVDDLRAVITAWPDIICLHLHCTTQATVQMDVLHMLFRSAPCLLDLALDIDTSSTWSMTCVGEFSYHRLQRLGLRLVNWSESILKLSSLTCFIDSLFPRVKTLDKIVFKYIPLTEDEERKADSKLADFVSLCQTTREIERNRHGVMEVRGVWYTNENGVWIKNASQQPGLYQPLANINVV